jgi:hypothetical protein
MFYIGNIWKAVLAKLCLSGLINAYEAQILHQVCPVEDVRGCILKRFVVNGHYIIRSNSLAYLLVLAEIISSALKIEAICSSETSIAAQHTTWRHIPEDDTLCNHRCVNLKSYNFTCYLCQPDSCVGLGDLRVTSKPVWEGRQAISALSTQNKITLLWVHVHSESQGTDADALVKEVSNNLSLDPAPAISFSSFLECFRCTVYVFLYLYDLFHIMLQMYCICVFVFV